VNLADYYQALFWFVVICNGVQQWLISSRRKLNIAQNELIEEMKIHIEAQDKILNDVGIQLIITKMEVMKK